MSTHGAFSACEALEARQLLAATFAESGFIDTAGFATGSDRQGDYLYIADSDRGLAIYNIARVGSPVLVASLTGLSVNDVTVKNNLAILSLDNGVQLVDVTDPTRPVELGAFQTAFPVSETEIGDGVAYVAGGAGGLTILNISNPSNPTLVTRLTTIGAIQIAPYGRYLYVADGSRGLRVIDATNPSAPIVSATLLAGYNVVDVERFSSNLLVMTRDNGLFAYSLATPTTPTHVGTTLAPNVAAMLSMDVDGPIAYVGTTTGLFALDMTVLNQPVFLGEMDLPIVTVQDVSAGGGVFVSAGDRGVELVSITDDVAQDIGGIITLTGTASDDFLSIQRTGTNQVLITRNGISQQMSLTDVTGFRINSLAGADYVSAEGDLFGVTIGGGSGPDTIVGSDQADLIRGGKGADRIWAESGNDTVLGEDGDDAILGGRGGDYLVGGSGNDTLQGGIGWDAIEGSDGNDYVAGGNGADTLYGQAGDDTIVGGPGNDLVFAWELTGRNVIQTLDGERDTIYANTAHDVLNIDVGLDVLA